MRWLLLLFAVAWFLIGLAVFALGRSAVHETLAAVCMVVAAVFFVGAALVERLDAIKRALLSTQLPPAV